MDTQVLCGVTLIFFNPLVGVQIFQFWRGLTNSQGSNELVLNFQVGTFFPLGFVFVNSLGHLGGPNFSGNPKGGTLIKKGHTVVKKALVVI